MAVSDSSAAGSSERRRLFVAAAVDDSTKDALARAAAELASRGVHGRFVPRDNYHVTLAFLGSVALSRIPDVSAAIGNAVVALPAFAVSLEEIGAFPNVRRPRTVWVGSRRAADAFARLVYAVREALAALDFIPDAREPGVHITLCRCDRDAAALPRMPWSPRRVEIHAVTLFASLLGRGAPRYSVVDRFALAPLASDTE